MNPSDDFFVPTLRLPTWDSAPGANVKPVAAVATAMAQRRGGASDANSARWCATPVK